MLSVLRLSKTSNFWVFSQHIMGYDPAKKSWVMAYRRLMGYPPYPNSGRAKKYGVPGIMGYQDLWVKGTSTVVVHSQQASGQPNDAISTILSVLRLSHPGLPELSYSKYERSP